MTTLTYPTGEVVTQTYNTAAQLASVTGLAPYASGLTYNVFGQIKQMTLGNGAVTSYDYYGDGGPAVNSYRLWRIQTLKSGNTLLNLQYGYDSVGNVKTLTDTVNANQIQSFSYDALDRLLSASTNAVGNGQYNGSYAYDPIGNLTSKAGDGNRVNKVENGVTTIYVGALFEKNLTTNVATSCYLANGKPIALRQFSFNFLMV